MGLLKYHIGYILTFLLLSGCVSNQRVQSNLPSPGKQCKILLTKNQKKTRKRVEKYLATDINETTSKNKDPQAQLLTQEEYLEQVAEVQRSLPKFDVEKDCPSSIKKRSGKKKKNFLSFLF